jgi:Zn-finger nucleic acid-binding protein
MVTLELADVEIDHCLDCGGIWLDAGELELLLNSPQAAKKILISFKPHTSYSEKKRRCPICNKKMEKIIVGQSTTPSMASAVEPLLIDRCPKVHGLWFDKGELKNIFDKAQLDGENKIKKILADMFGSEQSGSGSSKN